MEEYSAYYANQQPAASTAASSTAAAAATAAPGANGAAAAAMEVDGQTPVQSTTPANGSHGVKRQREDGSVDREEGEGREKKAKIGMFIFSLRFGEAGS
jgi:hypothetical protein